MNEQLEHKFSIRRIVKSTDDDYITALRIYNETTPVDIKTNTNEITFWLNENSEDYPFEVLYFVLYLDDIAIGFSMLTYIKRQRLIIIEYLSLYDQYRINAVFFSYISLLQNYLSIHNYDVAYMINEISNKGNGKETDKESKLFKKLICLEGFGKINAKYITLPLGCENYDSSFDAFLYIKSTDNVKSISKDTYLEIVKAMYYDYYLTWYKDLIGPTQIEQYKQKVDACLNEIQKSLNTKSICQVSYPHCPLATHEGDDHTYGVLPSKRKPAPTIMPIIILLVICGPIAIVWLYSFVLHLLDIPITSVGSIMGGILGAAITSVTTFVLAKKKL